jgi:hypothetical protein
MGKIDGKPAANECIEGLHGKSLSPTAGLPANLRNSQRPFTAIHDSEHDRFWIWLAAPNLYGNSMPDPTVRFLR